MSISEQVRSLEEENQRLKECIQFYMTQLNTSTRSYSNLLQAFMNLIDKQSQKPEFGEWRIVIPGILKDASKLGVSREHLWQVLTGRRRSPKLISRYRELKEQETA